MKSVVAIIVKDVERYIQELLCHHHLNGFDRMVVGVDMSTTDKTLAKLDGLPYEVRDKLDVQCVLSDIYQRGWYPQILRQYKNDTEWLAFLDDDEYLYIPGRKSVNEWLDTFPAEAEGITLPWILYGHNNHIFGPPEGITRLEYFTKAEDWPKQKATGKSFVRLASRPDFEYGVYIHFPGCGTTRLFDNVGRPAVTDQDVYLCNPIDWSGPVIAHYSCGSMEDWVAKQKRWLNLKARRCPDAPPDAAYKCHWFGQYDYPRTDERMLVYVDDLKELLTKCRN